MLVSENGVSVTGVGSVSLTPDVLVLRAGVEAVDGAPAAAFERANRAISAMLGVLRDGGAEDLRTAGVNVHSTGDASAKRPSYVAVQQLTARLTNLDGAGALVTTMVQAGGEAARLHGLSFAVSDPSAAVHEAREAAWRDAAAKAEQYAVLAGRKLGAVRRVQERGGETVFALAAGRARAPMAIEAGSEDITVSVEAEWAFAD